MTTSTVRLTHIPVAQLRTGMTTISGVARSVRTEDVHGRRHICWADDTTEPRIAAPDAVVQVTPDSVIRPMLAATGQVRGGTRVLTLTVERNDLGVYVGTIRAYDSNHPGDEHETGVYGDTDLAWVIETATRSAVDTLRPSAAGEGCGCWAGWDPHCGQPGCWGEVCVGESRQLPDGTQLTHDNAMAAFGRCLACRPYTPPKLAAQRAELTDATAGTIPVDADVLADFRL